MSLSVKLETVTPKQAEAWLKLPHANRPVAESRVVEYALDIEGGNWAENGETIKFNKGGELLDGQHRLQACALAGKPFKTLVVRGIDDEHAFATVDVGKTRTPGDLFALRGFPSYVVTAGGARLVYWYDNKLITPIGPKARTTEVKKLLAGKKFGRGARVQIPSKTELLEFAEKHRDGLIESMRYTQNSKTYNILTPSVALAAHFIFSRKSVEQANLFVHDLGRGSDLAGNDAVHVLREKLISARAGHVRLNQSAIFFYTVKAWNKRRAGEPCKQLRLEEGDNFPAAQ